MQNPFPGMNPFLERRWSGVHTRLVVHAAEQLEPQLPSDLFVGVEERLIVSTGEDMLRAVRPDVYVVEPPRATDRVREPGGTALAEPVVLRFSDEPERQVFLEIREMAGERLITSIELLSRSNKLPGAGRDEYLRKQEEVLASGASLVEIDLLREGACVLALPDHRIPERHRATYQVCVRRAWKPSEAELYPIRLQDPLPSIRVPLRERDADVRLDLQALLDQYHSVARQRPGLYDQPLEPPLSPEDAAWVRSILTDAGVAPLSDARD